MSIVNTIVLGRQEDKYICCKELSPFKKGRNLQTRVRESSLFESSSSDTKFTKDGSRGVMIG